MHIRPLGLGSQPYLQVSDIAMKSLSEKIRFLITGIIGAGLELASFYFLSAKGVFYIYAHLLAFNMAVFVTFFMHFTFTYRTGSQRENRFRVAFAMYLVLMYAMLLAGSAILYVLVELYKAPPILAKVSQMALIIPISYSAQKHKIFR